MTSKARSTRDPLDTLVTKRQVEGYVRFMLAEYDKTVRARYGSSSIRRGVGHSLRNGFLSLTGLISVAWTFVRHGKKAAQEKLAELEAGWV